MQEKIIVTGANGQLGSELRQILRSASHCSVFTDVNTLDLTSNIEALSFFENEKPDVIVNCAAYTAVDKAEEEWKKAESINVGIPKILAEYGTLSGCRIIHISTDYVFKGDLARPLKEEDATLPESRYGQSKLQGEQALMHYRNAIVIRTSWLYSIYGNNFAQSMLRLLDERDELKIVYDQIGSPTHGSDLASAIAQIIDQGAAGFAPGIYHYSNEGVASWYDFAYEIREISGASCNLLPIETKDYPLPAPRPSYAVLNKHKIKKEYGLKIPHWKSSLKTYTKRINR